MCIANNLFAQADSAGKGIKWVEGLSWEQVKLKALNENRFIFVDAYATWCAPCKKMDKEVYSNEQVGNALNPQFISVRVQMDQTAKDDQLVLKWYTVAKQFETQYGIEGYPSFLFFGPDGKLVYKALGMRNATEFIELTKKALTNPEDRYKESIIRFKNKELDYLSMPDLAREARQRKDKQTAIEIAGEFKQKYLDKLEGKEAFSGDNLFFIADFSWDIMKSDDRYFQFFYNNPAMADSIMKRTISQKVIQNIIYKEEIVDKIYTDGKPLSSSMPDWKKIQEIIRKKYGQPYIKMFFPDNQIKYFAIAHDWKNYIKYVNEKIGMYSPKVNGRALGPYGDSWTLNHYAWNLFLQCGDEKLLKKTLRWVDMAIKLDTSSYGANYIDTKANILYRMNRVKEAIQLQEFAVIRSRSDKAIVETLKKMKAGLPTWQLN
ncbi:thioredoxin family protein [Niastella yeongjuensis]|uniref:thioredoxin family protein n=1 Tax=Niastella yeongjuensis TaxID=354355 RepID=UPI0013FD414B|nr:thioredoxin family protein [Niastella yeongjuensis]